MFSPCAGLPPCCFYLALSFVSLSHAKIRPKICFSAFGGKGEQFSKRFSRIKKEAETAARQGGCGK
jgi:hypothetical protein